MILCDTNILIEFYKGNAQVVEELRHIGHPQLAASVVTVAELYFGALNKKELRSIKQHLASVRQFQIDVPVSEQLLELMEHYSLSHKLSLPDALIAATAMAHGLELYTLNKRDFHFIPGLKLYEP